VLFSAHERGLSLPELFATLPKRYSRSALLRNFPRESGRRIVELLSAPSAAAQLAQFFTDAHGFCGISRLDYTDGVRILFANGDVAHFRPSGNADEFRIYAVADTQARADTIVAAGIAEPDGIIRSMERALL
jgi:phosphomannomutase